MELLSRVSWPAGNLRFTPDFYKAKEQHSISGKHKEYADRLFFYLRSLSFFFLQCTQRVSSRNDTVSELRFNFDKKKCTEYTKTDDTWT